MNSENVVRLTPYYIEYSLDCGEDGEMERFLRCFDTKDELFYFTSKMYAFDDCYDFRVHAIVCDGVDCNYVGWVPGMRYAYRDCETREIVWDCSFPEWDH